MLAHLVFSKHARQRMTEQGISVQDVRQVLEAGDVLRRYPEDRPSESRLVLAFVAGRPLHVVAADAPEAGTTFVITAYEPDPALWQPGFKTKRSDG